MLYCEGESDRRILEAWAKRLDHPAGKFFRNPFLHPLGGRRTREARHHLFGVRAVHKDIRGLLLVDADGGEDLHDLSADGLDIHVWRRYEIENYLLVPAAVARFLSGGEENDLFVRNAFIEELPASVLTDPLRDIEAVIRIPASKTIMPKLFDNTQLPLRKADYYRIAEAMKPEEIHPEVIQVLDKTLMVSAEPPRSMKLVFGCRFCAACGVESLAGWVWWRRRRVSVVLSVM